MSGKIGEGTMAAMGRLGLKELRNAINPSRESVADNEIGIYGSMTQGEIADARGGPGSGPDQEELSVDSMRKEAQIAKEMGQERENNREIEQEMER